MSFWTVLSGLSNLLLAFIGGLFDFIQGMWQVAGVLKISLGWLINIFPPSWMALLTAGLALALFKGLYPYLRDLLSWVITVLVPKVP